MRLDVNAPEAGQGHFHVTNPHVEVLVQSQLFVRIDRVRRGEIDMPRIGGPTPQPNTRKLSRDLYRMQGVGRRKFGRRKIGNRKRVELRVRTDSRAIRQPLAVFGKRECGHAGARAGDLARLAAVRSHHVKLVGCTSATAPCRWGKVRCSRSARRQDAWTIGAGLSRCCVTVRQENKEATIRRTGRAYSVLGPGERELFRARYAARGTHKIDVALASGLLPVGNALRIE